MAASLRAAGGGVAQVSLKWTFLHFEKHDNKNVFEIHFYLNLLVYWFTMKRVQIITDNYASKISYFFGSSCYWKFSLKMILQSSSFLRKEEVFIQVYLIERLHFSTLIVHEEKWSPPSCKLNEQNVNIFDLMIFEHSFDMLTRSLFFLRTLTLSLSLTHVRGKNWNVEVCFWADFLDDLPDGNENFFHGWYFQLVES